MITNHNNKTMYIYYYVSCNFSQMVMLRTIGCYIHEMKILILALKVERSWSCVLEKHWKHWLNVARETMVRHVREMLVKCTGGVLTTRSEVLWELQNYVARPSS